LTTLGQQGDAKGLIGRLRQVLGPACSPAQPSIGLYAPYAEDLPGLYLHVGPDGSILRASKALAEALGAQDPAHLRGRSIREYLPAVAPGSPLCQEIWEKGEIRNVPVRLTALQEGTWSTALLSARGDGESGMVAGAWMGCLTLPSAEGLRVSLPAGIDWGLLDGIRVELQSQLENLSLHLPPGDGSGAPASPGASVRLYLNLLPRLEAILALNTPPTTQTFNALASMAELCRSAGRLLNIAGVNLIFDAEPSFPALVTADENRLRTCLKLLLGVVSITEDPREIIVRLTFEDPCLLNIEVVVSPANTRPALSDQRSRQIELSKMLAATADGVVSVALESPNCHKYSLRVRLPATSESDMAIQPVAETPKMINRALRGLRVLFVGPGEMQKIVFAKWIERQQARFLHAPTPLDAQQACSGVQPDVAVLDLSVCQSLPDFLSEVPVLGLRGTLAPAPEWCQTFIEKPIFEEDMLDGIDALHPPLNPAEREPQGSAVSKAVRILAVDDNPVNQRVIQKMLARLGYEVDLASNGLEAIAILQKRPYDAILMDLEMPILDGIGATAAIRQLPAPLCRIPIVAVTAHAIRGDRETCLQAGMDDYLSKPVNVDLLRHALHRWLPRSPNLLRQAE
jgi:CheY-like chemotaxis protein